MLVKDLLKKLKTLPQDKPIYLAIDAEGNGFSNIDEVAPTDDTMNTFVVWPKHDDVEL